MKLGLSLYTYGSDISTGRMTVKEAIKHAASLEVQGIELIDEQHFPNWPLTRTSDVIELRKYIQSFGMKVSCFDAYVPDMVRTNRRETFEELKEEIIYKMVLADLLEVRNIRMLYIGSGFEMMEDMMIEVLPELEKYDKVWGLEIHAPFSAPEYLEFYKNSVLFNSPQVKLIPDFSCWQTKGLPSQYGNEDLSSLVDLVPYACHVHAKAHHFDEDGEVMYTPYGDLIRTLKENGYDGHISAEYEGWWWKVDDPGKAKENATKLTSVIKKYM